MLVVIKYVDSGTIKREKKQWRAGEGESGKQVFLLENVTFGILWLSPFYSCLQRVKV